MNKITIETIKTDCGLFVRQKSEGYRSNSGIDHLLFDGKSGEKTHNSTWLKIPGIPTKVERIEKTQPPLLRYKLTDPSLTNDKIPLVLDRDKVICDSYGEWEHDWKPEFSHLRSLYEADREPVIESLVNVDVEFVTVLEIDNLKDYGGFSYPVQKTRWASEGDINLVASSIIHDTVDTIIFPDIVLEARNSRLSSQDSYRVVRKHVQTNINPKYARITSDYDFCFTVMKKIPLAKPVAYQKDISGWKARKPKYVTDYRHSREVQVFEMTYSPENYKGYTPIKGFQGKNIEDLKINIDTFLKELINKVNEPLCDCKACGGSGVILES